MTMPFLEITNWYHKHMNYAKQSWHVYGSSFLMGLNHQLSTSSESLFWDPIVKKNHGPRIEIGTIMFSILQRYSPNPNAPRTFSVAPPKMTQLSKCTSTVEHMGNIQFLPSWGWWMTIKHGVNLNIALTCIINVNSISKYNQHVLYTIVYTNLVGNIFWENLLNQYYIIYYLEIQSQYL